MKTTLQKIEVFCKKPAVYKTVGYLALQLCMVAMVYYWRVFYGYTGSALKLTAFCCAAATAVYAAVLLTLRFTKTFPTRVAAAIAVCGIVFCFANPPLQAPDESVHYLRSYSISKGWLNFDYERTYPNDVTALLKAFPGAWTNGNTSYWVEVDDKTGEISKIGSSANFPIKQTADGMVAISQQFAKYNELKQTQLESVTEPVMFQILPFLPQAFGMLIARIVGLQALGCLYLGRLANLAVYTVLCWLALRNCKRYQTIFAAMMLLPLSLYLAASLSYDSLLLGLYYMTASYYCTDEIRKKDVVVFLISFVLMNAVKPWISLLWLLLPLVLPKKAWKVRLKKWHLAAAGVAGAVGMTLFVEWYGNAMRLNYPEIGRMLGSDVVNGGQQLAFVLQNIPRTISVFLGTLYENTLYFGQLGVFGALDLEIPMVQLISVIMLFLATALAVHEKSSLSPRSAVGLGFLALCYVGAVMAALYITYTPVGMVRVLGVQARYMLPPFLMLFVLLAGLLSHVLEPKLPQTDKANKLGLCICAGGALLSGILLAQHYFIGPVYHMPL